MSAVNQNFLTSGARLEENYSGTDDDGSVYNDGASVTSETSTIHGGELEDGNNAVDESSKVEIFESKLKEALELATQKSAGGRVKALDSICSAFQKRYCPDFIENQQMTTCDLVERSLKKGKASEAEAGAEAAEEELECEQSQAAARHIPPEPREEVQRGDGYQHRDLGQGPRQEERVA